MSSIIFFPFLGFGNDIISFLGVWLEVTALPFLLEAPAWFLQPLMVQVEMADLALEPSFVVLLKLYGQRDFAFFFSWGDLNHFLSLQG
tara:strand:+ start:101 stop:364 length:264 start_codon:yes stop_codon:yes gene_type:complete